MSGLLLQTLTPTKLGFWSQTVESTDLQVLSMSHKIINHHNVETQITIHNVGSQTVNASVYISYLDPSHIQIANLQFDVSILAGDSTTKTDTVNLEVEEWASTDVSITEIEEVVTPPASVAYYITVDQTGFNGSDHFTFTDGNVGDQVTLLFENIDTLVDNFHPIQVKSPSGTVLGTTSPLDAGQSDSITFITTESGTYTFKCVQGCAGHSNLQDGNMIVNP